MFTLFDLLKLIGPLAGIASGLALGRRYFGIVGGILGALIGLFVGLFVGGLPERLVLWWAKRQLGRKSARELRATLRATDCLTPNLILLELRRRGEDVQQELPVVLAMLVASDLSQRGRGWAALNTAFPELARRLGDYRISDSVEDCLKKTQTLRVD